MLCFAPWPYHRTRSTILLVRWPDLSFRDAESFEGRMRVHSSVPQCYTKYGVKLATKESVGECAVLGILCTCLLSEASDPQRSQALE